RKIFRITSKGRKELEEWLLRPVARQRALRDELFIKLLFLDPDEDRDSVLELIEKQKQIYMRRMQSLTRRKVELSERRDRRKLLVTDLLMDAALFHAEADLRWLEHTRQKLQSPPARGKRREER
ncbi:MAG: hypothetical protein ACREQY_19720, partial [Candidatus Binatia bacterium]